MSTEDRPHLPLRLAHVLFLDLVGYSKMLIDDQREILRQMNELIRATPHFREADAAQNVIPLPSGDGMALVFLSNPEDPVECALEVSEALQNYPQIKLRMGVHSGPVSGVIDVNERSIVAGAGINMAQRVMDVGDAGHILLSKRAAEDLLQYRHWEPYLHHLGEVEVKHGVTIKIVNLYTEKLGNPELPGKMRQSFRKEAAARRLQRAFVVGLILVALTLSLALFFGRRQTTKLSASSALIPEKSIAVLPFENLSDDKQNAYFADGVQDALLTDLARIADLKVISRTSVMQYRSGSARNLREIGLQLGVAHLLEGSVQRAGGKVRVNAQLIDARTDGHLWAEYYDRPLDDVFAIQSEIAQKIAGQLRAQLSAGEKAAIETPPTRDLAAYDLYLRAQALYADTSEAIHAREKLPQAAALLDKAVASDPQFLLAWCLLARAHGQIYFQGYDHTPGRLELVNAAAQSALRVQPDAGEAHLALAGYHYRGFRDYARARTELAIARRTLPNNAELCELTGFIDRREGRWEEATRSLERALELDPRNFFTLQELAANTYQPQRRYADATRLWDRKLTFLPGDPVTRMLNAQVALDWRADIKPFQTMLAQLIAEDPSVAPGFDDPLYSLCERTAAAAARVLTNYPRDGVGYNGVNYPHAYWEGVVARWQGDSAKAHAAFNVARGEVAKMVEQEPNSAAPLSLLGMIDAGLGRKEDALRAGRRACELLPISKDAIDGVALAINLAQIYAWTGEKDLALEQIAAVERVPNYLSYGFLKLQPMWDSLHGDPRYEKIVTSLAPQ